MAELDVVFSCVHFEKISPVKQAKRMPKLEGRALYIEITRRLERMWSRRGGNVWEVSRNAETENYATG